MLSLAVPGPFPFRLFYISVALPACWTGGLLLLFLLRVSLLLFRRDDGMGSLFSYGVKRRVKRGTHNPMEVVAPDLFGYSLCALLDLKGKKMISLPYACLHLPNT